MDDDDRVRHYIELWKQTVAVQQHFNDLEWRIRQLALTALTFDPTSVPTSASQCPQQACGEQPIAVLPWVHYGLYVTGRVTEDTSKPSSPCSRDNDEANLACGGRVIAQCAARLQGGG